jgi:hypothetical protein
MARKLKIYQLPSKQQHRTLIHQQHQIGGSHSFQHLRTIIYSYPVFHFVVINFHLIAHCIVANAVAAAAVAVLLCCLLF